MDINFVLPDSNDTTPATDRQKEAVALFYEVDFGDSLSAEQAHALLSCREFARLSAATIFRAWPAKVQSFLARAIAAFIVSDEHFIQYVVKWSEKAYSRGSASPRVRGAPIFPEVERFGLYLEVNIELNGWTKDKCRSGSWR